MSEERLTQLVHLCLHGRPTLEERKELLEYAADSRYKAVLDQYMERAWKQGALQQVFTEAEQDAMIDYTLHQDHKVKKLTWFKAAAAIVLLIIGAAVYFALNRNAPNENTVVVQAPQELEDVLPGSGKAVLTLSTGERVLLSDTSKTTIRDGALDINNTNGSLSYIGSQVAAMNTMSTPNGGQYKLTLADGTKVWLNASSSITYPTAFTNTTREVSITGEAYFEVSANKQQPFIVKTRGEEIRVVGTQFNVNSYENEPDIKTSLVEGVVYIGTTILKPGEAYVNGKVVPTDINQDISWKNGFFKVNGADISTLMRQFERWYDISVRYEGRAPSYKFHGELDRGLKLSEVLEILSEQGVQYSFKNKILVIQN